MHPSNGLPPKRAHSFGKAQQARPETKCASEINELYCDANHPNKCKSGEKTTYFGVLYVQVFLIGLDDHPLVEKLGTC